MNEITELTLDELIALDVLPLEEAKDEGVDVVFECAVALVEAGYCAVALPYLKEALDNFYRLLDRHITAYSLLDNFSNMKVDDGDEFTPVRIETKLLRKLSTWCDGKGGHE